MFVKPKAGLKVRDPFSMLNIPEEGAEVPEESIWLRRLQLGDVLLVNQIPDSSQSSEKEDSP